MSSNNQYSNWNGWVQTSDGLQAQEEDGQGPYHPYYQSAPRGDNVDDLTHAFESTTVQDDPSHGQDGYNDQYEEYTGGNYCPSGAVDTGSMVLTGEEDQSQAFVPTAPSYTPVPPSGSKRGDKGSRYTKKGPGDKIKGGRAPASKEQRSKGQQSQSAMYGGPDPFFNPQDQNLADASTVVDPPQEDAAYHSHHQAPYGIPNDQQDSTAFVGGYGYGQKPYNDGYRPPRQTKPPKKSTGKQKENSQQWLGDNVPAYGNGYENVSDPRDSTGQDEGYGTGFEESVDDGYGTGDVDTSSGPSVVPYSDPYPGPQDEFDDDGVKTPTRTSPMLQPTTMEYQDDELHNYPVYPEPSFPAEDDPIAGPGDLDNRYVIENSSRFAPGEVFKTLWSEPLGGTSKNENMTEVQVRDHMGQKFYVGVRRFIVVANDEGNCTCVPILTYERRGCTKKGVKANKHGIVYPSTGRAVSLPHEPQLGFRPVRLKLDNHAEKLAKESRINYAKLTTIEHNVRVLFIGRIVREDFNVVTRAVEECWAAKLHRAGERSNKQQAGGGGGNRRR